MTLVDLMGGAASGLLVLSVARQQLQRLRYFSLAASVLWVVYVSYLSLWPLVVTNVTLALVNLYQPWQERHSFLRPQGALSWWPPRLPLRRRANREPHPSPGDHGPLPPLEGIELLDGTLSHQHLLLRHPGVSHPRWQNDDMTLLLLPWDLGATWEHHWRQATRVTLKVSGQGWRGEVLACHEVLAEVSLQRPRGGAAHREVLWRPRD